jgi:hypothetical protein
VDVLQDPDAQHSRLVQAYLDAKRQLAKAFRTLAVESVADRNALTPLISRLEESMDILFPTVPEEYRRVKGFGASHRILYSYLSVRLESDVALDELRILTGDAVHTERRLRELRRLGLQIAMLDSGGFRTCRVSQVVNLGTASREWVLRAIAADKSLDRGSASELTTLVAEG